MHSTENLRTPQHMAALRILQFQLHKVSGRKDSGEWMRRPWALTSLNFGIETVRLAPKPSGRAIPCSVARQAANRNLAPMPPAERYTLYGNPSGPGADSRLEASGSSNSSNPKAQFKSRGAGCTKDNIVSAWLFGMSALRALKMPLQCWHSLCAASFGPKKGTSSAPEIAFKVSLGFFHGPPLLT